MGKQLLKGSDLFKVPVERTLMKMSLENPGLNPELIMLHFLIVNRGI